MIFNSCSFAKFFNPTAELVIPKGIPTKEGKAEIEIHPETLEAKIKKCSILFRVVQILLFFLLINLFCFITLTK